MRMRHIAICGLPGWYHIIPHYLINGTNLEKEITELKMYFYFLLNVWSKLS